MASSKPSVEPPLWLNQLGATLGELETINKSSNHAKTMNKPTKAPKKSAFQCLFLAKTSAFGSGFCSCIAIVACPCRLRTVKSHGENAAETSWRSHVMFGFRPPLTMAGWKIIIFGVENHLKMYVRTYVRTCIYIYTHMYIVLYTYIYIYTSSTAQGGGRSFETYRRGWLL